MDIIRMHQMQVRMAAWEVDKALPDAGCLPEGAGKSDDEVELGTGGGPGRKEPAPAAGTVG